MKKILVLSLIVFAVAEVMAMQITTDSIVSVGLTKSSTLSGFSGNAGDKIIVTVACEGNSYVPAVSSITYGGTSMVLVDSFNDGTLGVQHTSMWYLDLAGDTTGDVVVTLGGNANGIAISAVAADGLMAGGALDTFAADGTSASLDATAAGLAVASFVANGGAAPGVDTNLTTVFSSDNIGSATAASGYDIIEASGTLVYDFTSSSSRPVTVGAVFATPEPATMAILGLGGLFIRRRK